ncbi:MAG: tetratricopeptide repeat protein [Spirochaetaceae bacterium]|jgi:tetratricopeptide (TPR) repeat protein|nr:tetratricopeptide repeat protein [Spirochaetaceae bacterium]
MDSIVVPIIIIVAILAGGGIGIKLFSGHRPSGMKHSKDSESLLKEVNKRLAQNPRDPEALFALADIYFKQESWDKAFRTYEILNDLADGTSKIDAFEVHLRYGLCALREGYPEAAYKGFNQAWTIKQDNFDVNYNMGVLEFQQKNYEKAVQFLSLARKQNGEHALTFRYIGHALFKLVKYKEAMAFLRKCLELSPGDKESLYVLGECYQAVGQFDQALKIFTHLRLDPKRGPQAALAAGNINMKQHKLTAALEDFEFGLKHEHIDPDTLIELRYQLSMASLGVNEIGKAVTTLKTIQAQKPDYKNVANLIEEYEELNSNRNLQIFILAPSTDFVALCRRIVLSYYHKSRTKINNVMLNRNEWVDISAEVETIKWSDLILFRFIRSQGSSGELIVRDFHSRLKETKAGRGICITVGSFSDEARKFTEARLIDLLEKEQLLAILSMVDAKITMPQPDKFADFIA